MLVRVPLLGTGKPDDHYRAELPNYTTVEVDIQRGFIIADVPDEDFPPEPSIRAGLVGRANLRRNRGSWPLQRDYDAWHAHLDQRYQEHAGRFRPIPD